MFQFIRILLLLITVQIPQIRRRGIFHSPDEIAHELTRRKIRRRKPPVRKKIEKRRKEFVHPKYKSTKPRDHRFSDQQKIRRMFRNS
jgi:hypothetical protein